MTTSRMRTAAGPDARARASANPRSRTGVGLLVLLVFAALVIVVYQKERVVATAERLLGGAETIEAEFAQHYKLRPYSSKVKIAGVVVGAVTDVEASDTGRATVSMQVERGTSRKLAAAPSAGIRPTSLLGGNYYVELVPSGAGEFSGERIPVERTSVPVELDRVLSAIDPGAQQGMQSAIGQLDGVLEQGGTAAVRDLLRHAPESLGPAGEALQAARGTRPGRDLTELVTGLQHTAAALTQRSGQVGETVDALAATTAALASEREPLARAVATMPDTLRVTRAGLADLQPTLDQLVVTAEEFRPSAEALGPLVTELEPALERARPLLDDLRPLLADLDPAVHQLVPVAGNATDALADIRGPVLDRLNGPIKENVLAEWTGTGPYQGGGGNGHRLYEEVGYLASRSAGVFGWYDKSSAFARVSLGVGANTVGGFSGGAEQYLETLGLQPPPGPQPDPGPDGGPVAPGEAGGSR